MPRRYNLRKRQETVKWIEDDTLKDKDEGSEEDSDFESPEETEASEDISLDEEDDDDGDDAFEKETGSTAVSGKKNIMVPMPKRGMRVTIQIEGEGYKQPPTELDEESEVEEEFEEDEESEESEEEEEVMFKPLGKKDFLNYLMNKYVPPSKAGRNRKHESKIEESPALQLNEEEIGYYLDQSKSKRKNLNKKMKELSLILADGDVPHKFRVLELPISNPIKAMVIKKIDTLEDLDADSGESHKLRTWVDGFLRVPFGKHVPLPVNIDDGPKPCSEFLSHTRKTLDKAVYGMGAAKTQIMQVLAQWISNPDSVGNVIALKGPMGVGKTSFAKNGVAAVLKRPFEFFSLGGASDAANFVGHSYTYEGSTWGRVVDSLVNARCMNPVMYFDELDKISTTPHGEEIVSMLIHMTDRSQNTQFHDRYFSGVDFDLSQCLFVFSFNDESKVHPILKDRMQVIHCAGYSADEKKVILTQYVWPQVMERIKIDGLTISEDAVKYLISDHSKDEEGVRTLIRSVETLVTRINLLRIADDETAQSYKFYKKIAFPCKIDVELARHILQDLVEPGNESWRRMYM